MSNCQVYIENFITHLAPVLSAQAEKVETLAKGATYGGLNESNDRGRFSNRDLPSFKEAFRNVSKLQSQNPC